MYSSLSSKKYFSPPSVSYTTGLGATNVECRWVKMTDGTYRWTCFKTGGGGTRPMQLRGAGAAQATAHSVSESVNDQVNDLAPGGFDFMQFLSDNWIWLAVAVGGVILITMMSKKGRK